MKVKFNLPVRRFNSKLNYDFNSTFDFGYIQPSLCKFAVPHSKWSINASQLVRCSPLVVPSFGRMAFHNVFAYVPMSLMFPAFDSFLSQTNVRGTTKTYIPSSLPSTTNNLLASALLSSPIYSTCYTFIPAEDPDTHKKVMRGYTQRYIQTSIGILKVDITHDEDKYSLSYNDCLSRSWDYTTFVNSPSGKLFHFYKLTQLGRSIYNVLRGLGYSLDIVDNSPVSALPIIAFAKSSFDLLFPHRDLNWHNTQMYSLINEFYNGDFWEYVHNGHSFMLFGIGDKVPISSIQDLISAISDFVLAPVSRNISNIATASPILSQSASPSIPAISYPFKGSNVKSGGVIATDGIPQASYLKADSLSLANKLWSFVQRSTVVGQDVKDWFKVHFGISPSEDMYNESVLIRDVVNLINVNTVVSSADTKTADSGEVLGGLAGQAYSAENSTIQFDVKNFGYLICLSYVVPVCRPSSGCQPELYNTSYFDMPFPDFDGLGYEALNALSFQSFEGLISQKVNSNQGFGFVPRLTSYKVINNIRSGGFALNSLKDSYLPYCLDNVVDIKPYNFPKDGESAFNFNPSSASLINSQSLAWYFPYTQFKDRSNGDFIVSPWRVFDNIFYNVADVDEKLGLHFSPNNFLCQSSFNISVSSYLKPLSDSYEIEEIMKNITSVDKS